MKFNLTSRPFIKPSFIKVQVKAIVILSVLIKKVSLTYALVQNKVGEANKAQLFSFFEKMRLKTVKTLQCNQYVHFQNPRKASSR